MDARIRQALGGLALAAVLGIVVLVSPPGDRGPVTATAIGVALVSLGRLAWVLLEGERD